MFNRLKILTITFMALTLVNCGKKGGGAASPDTSQAAADASQIQINNNGDVITWSQSSNNIYVAAPNNCVRGLNTNSDDDTPAKRSEELALLINSSRIEKGKLQSPGANSIYLNISYNSGETRTFNLQQSAASTSEDTLSNGAEIIAFFDRVNLELQQTGRINCNNGKK